MIWGSMVPPLSQKVAIFYRFVSRFVLISWLFLIFQPILRAGFFDKMLALSNKKATFVLVSGVFGCCIFTILFKYYLETRFSTETAP